MDLRKLRGVGAAYSDRLHEAGVRDVADLAWVSDLAALSEQTGIPRPRLAAFQSQAVRVVASHHRAPHAAIHSVVSGLLDFGAEVGAAVAQGFRRARTWLSRSA